MFKKLKEEVQKQYAKMRKQNTQMLSVEVNRDTIWDTYLQSFAHDPKEMQDHNCNCCKAFMRQVGCVVTIHNNELVSVWDFDEKVLPSIYQKTVIALREYIHSLKIHGLHTVKEGEYGKDKNFSEKHNVTFEHFSVNLAREAFSSQNDTLSGRLRSNVGVLIRGVTEIKQEAIETVLELIEQNSLYRGQEHKANLQAFLKVHQNWSSLTDKQKDVTAWQLAMNKPAVAGIKNTSIGTLLVSLSEGESLEKAVGAFERMVAPSNYRRPTALVTPRMIETAKKRLEELGLMSALNRRKLDDRDLTAAHALYVYRPTSKNNDVFAQLTEDQPVNIKTLDKVEEVSINDFIEKVLPTAKSIKAIIERSHLGNFVTLTGAEDPEAKNLMKWDNSFAWSYTGGVADSIKEKVKAAGGNVDGWMRISLAWHNHDDLDLHFKSKKEHIYYANKRSETAFLDVDMNAGGGRTRTPVENISIRNQLPTGSYTIIVNQFNKRETCDTGYELEVEVNGATYNFNNAKSPNGSQNHSIAFKVLNDGQVVFDNNTSSQSVSSTIKWGISTNKYSRVRAITLSPNHWTKPVGNKHWFFILEGCVSDEQTRPFYNEFLVGELSDDKKTTEVLAGKIQVTDAQGAEMSGIGFSESIRNHLYLEVEGTFKRVIKVIF